MEDIVKSQFNELSENYDKNRKMIIPCFEDFYYLAVSVAESQKQKPEILDIGAGTGLFSAMILKKYPNARVTLIDFAENMLEKAKVRFTGNPNLNFINGDYRQFDFKESYDIVISAMSIHHLTDNEKCSLYKKVFGLLNQEGIFINADLVLGSTPYLRDLYKKSWENKVTQSGLSETEILEWGERIKEDMESEPEKTLNWLREAGFSDADIMYKYFQFAVIFCRKI